MTKYCYLLIFLIFLFYLFYFETTKALFEDINVYNMASSDKYIAIESDEEIDNKKNHYIFLYNVENKEIIRIFSNNNKNINSSMYFPSLSKDGRYLTFTSRADNITKDKIGKCLDISDNLLKNCSNIYLYDIENRESLLLKFNGNNFDGDNYVSKISGNGNDIVFESISDNLLENNYDCTPINGIKNCINIYKYNINTGKILLISTRENNYGGNFNSINPSISYDGRFVTFQSNSNNLLNDKEIPKYCNNYITNEMDVCSNIFYVDTLNMMTSVLSYEENKFFNDNSGNAIISGDGKFVVFESYASNISRERNRHLHFCDIINHKCEIISQKDGVLNNKESFVDDISFDGKYVLYRTNSSNLEEHKGIDLYVYNTLSKKNDLISNENVINSFFYLDSVYYYSNDLLFDKIDDKKPVLDNTTPIYILKNNLLNVIDKLIVYDNLSNRANISIYLDGLDKIELEGEYLIQVKMIDEFNNIAFDSVLIIVLDNDNEPPIFNDVDKIKIMKGSINLNLSEYIKVSDKIDGETKIYIIDDGNLNLNVAGNYKLKLMSKDKSNNVVYKQIEVNVYEKYDFNYFWELIIILGMMVVFIFSIIKVK